jgi:hypothetical protein
MSTVVEPLEFMTYTGALCITEPGRLHVPLSITSPDTSPGYKAARNSAIARLPPGTHLPLDAPLLSLYFHHDEPVRLAPIH